MELLLQDWIGIMFTIFAILGMIVMWVWLMMRQANQEKPTFELVPLALIFIVITGMGVGSIFLIWGGRAYFLAHRTEANNEAAAKHEQEIMKTPELDENLVAKIRAEREAKENQRKLDEEKRKTFETRQKSDEYLKSLEGKETK